MGLELYKMVTPKWHSMFRWNIGIGDWSSPKGTERSQRQSRNMDKGKEMPEITLTKQILAIHDTIFRMHFSIINFDVDLSVNFVPCVIMLTSELLCDTDEKMGFGWRGKISYNVSPVQPKIMCIDCSVRVRGFLQNARAPTRPRWRPAGRVSIF